MSLCGTAESVAPFQLCTGMEAMTGQKLAIVNRSAIDVTQIPDDDAQRYVKIIDGLTSDLLSLELSIREDKSRRNALRREKERGLMKITSFDLRIGDQVSYDGNKCMATIRVDLRSLPSRY